MTLIQRVKLLMYKVVRSFLNACPTTIKNLPGISSNLKKLDENIKKIEEAAVQQAFGSEGASSRKKELKFSLADITYDCSRKLIAFGNNEHNTTLLEELKFSLSDLKKMSDSNLLIISNGVYNRANNGSEELIEYGITPAFLTSFMAAITTFDSVVSSSRSLVTDGKYTTSEIGSLFDETDGIIDNIDKIIEIIRTSEPSIYKNYKEKRKLPEASHAIISLKATVIDAQTKLGIKGVTLFITYKPEGSTPSANDNVIIKKTAEKGGILLKLSVPGTYHIQATKFGYVSQEVTVPINSGELTVVELALHKI